MASLGVRPVPDTGEPAHAALAALAATRAHATIRNFIALLPLLGLREELAVHGENRK
jgi:hypothetical protein